MSWRENVIVPPEGRSVVGVKARVTGTEDLPAMRSVEAIVKDTDEIPDGGMVYKSTASDAAAPAALVLVYSSREDGQVASRCGRRMMAAYAELSRQPSPMCSGDPIRSAHYQDHNGRILATQQMAGSAAHNGKRKYGI